MLIITIGDVVVGLFILFWIFSAIFTCVKDAIKKKRCKHKRYFENMRCHVICYNCSKDLGFIGDLPQSVIIYRN